MIYESYFEIDGKKMRTKVDAENAFDAMKKVEKKMGTTNIFFYKTIEVKPQKKDMSIEFLKDFFGMK